MPTETSPEGTSAVLAGRYGKTRDQRMPATFTYALVIIIAVVVVAYMWNQYGEQGGRTDISATQVGYTIDSDDATTFTIDVTRGAPDAPGYCIVRAMDVNFTEVARKSVLVQPSESTTVRIEDRIITRERAAAVDVFGCSMTVPEYLTGG